MSKTQRIQRPKGTQDILASTSIDQWQGFETLFRQQCHQYGLTEIRTPIFESTELFSRGVGETTDIVNKEMYTFTKGDRSITLRPEGTAGVVRAFIEHGLSKEPKPVKVFYMGPMFRYERPQAGRQRQFHQAGVEFFGLGSPSTDAEAIALAMDTLKSVGLNDLELEINDIGSAADRETFRNTLRKTLSPINDKLCSTCQNRLITNPFRILDCKNSTCNSLTNTNTINTLLQSKWTNADSQAHFAQVLELLSALNISYTRNHKLVRGLDYYNSTVFEITSGDLGAKNTVCGGGRYDSLVETLGGPSTPAVGWALGIERLLQLATLSAEKPSLYYLTCENVSTMAATLQLATTIRRDHPKAIVIVDHSGRKLKKQLETAHKRNADFVLLSDDDPPNAWQIKNLRTGEQQAF